MIIKDTSGNRFSRVVPAFTASLLIIVAVVSGCGPDKGKLTVTAPALVGYLPAGSSDTAEKFIKELASVKNPEKTDADSPVNMLIIYQQAKIDRSNMVRIEVNLVLLDRDSRPLKRSGKLWAVLGVRLDDEYQPVGCWEFSSEQLSTCYRQGMISGYALDLRWPRIENTSVYPLTFHWTSASSGDPALTSSVTVVDSLRTADY